MSLPEHHVNNTTQHARNMREAMRNVTEALGEGDPGMVTFYMRWARDHAREAQKAAYTSAEQIAADYLANFVADMTTILRRDGLIDSQS